MADQKKRGGQKVQTKSEGDQSREHQGVHPGSQQTHGKEDIGHKSGHGKIVPDKGE